MTVTFPIGDPAPPSQPVLPIGSLVYLSSYLIRMALNAEYTGPDTPNLYSAHLEILGDQGDLQIDPLVGPQGYPGQHHFPLRKQDLPLVYDPDDLPTNLTDTPADIGKYWLIMQLDEWGNITGQQAWIWWGTDWRTLMMGSYGQPGPVPNITPEINVIEPQTLPTYPDTSSSIDTSGTIIDPTWVYNLPLPAGPPGPVTYLYDFPDVDTSTPAVPGDLMGATGQYTTDGLAIWRARSVDQYLNQPWSMPESAFSAYTGVSQQAAIGSYILPPQPWPWTVVVWGQMGSTGGGFTLTANPLMIGCQVLLGDPVNGTLIARGLGNTLGKVAVMPHYSRSDSGGSTSDSITPTNRRALVPANHSSPAQGTVYINLWNDGAYGVYNFHPKDAQLFMMVVPMLRES
jgi:hypothetical protein